MEREKIIFPLLLLVLIVGIFGKGDILPLFFFVGG
jgi:hypothetical protein